MKRINLNDVLKDNLRQIENEMKYYSETGNQRMLFSLIAEHSKISKQIIK